jgi:N utilization substance protein A
VKYITSSFSPAKILQVNLLDPVQRKALVVVSDDMLSLAIGKRGTNVNLVSQLTGWQIDVRSETQVREAAQKRAILTVEELSKIKGVGKKLADILLKAGWKDVERIANAKIGELTSLQGIGGKKAQKIIDAAKDYLAGKRAKTAAEPKEKTVEGKAQERGMPQSEAANEKPGKAETPKKPKKKAAVKTKTRKNKKKDA